MTAPAESAKMRPMKRAVRLLFPLFFGLLNFLLYWVLFRPAWGERDWATALLAFFAALGWGGLIFNRAEPLPGLRRLYAALAVFLPPLLAWLVPGIRIDPLLHGLIYLLILLGMAMLLLYLWLGARRGPGRK